METSSVSPANTLTASSGGNETSESAVISSDFETFLKMLTTQMQNQDPLNPVDSADYATQLATFASVEQQVQTNDILRELTGKLTGSAFQSMANWIGKEALAEAPVYYAGQAIMLRPEYSSGADRATLVVSDANGTEVQRLELDMSKRLVAWTGIDETGQPLPAGTYSFEVASHSGGTEIARQAAKAYNPIVEVRQDGDIVMLTLSDGTEVDATDITALRSGV